MSELGGSSKLSQVFVQRSLVAFGLKPAPRAFLADSRGEGFVEVGVASGEDALVA